MEPQRHFLIRDGADPQALRLGETLRFGRHESCEIRLESRKASRQHAQIEWVADRAVLRDLGSNNGSFVNDERIDFVELQDGDELRFATYIAIYRCVSRIEDLSSNDSTCMTTTGMVPTFSGHLQHNSLLEVLNRLQRELANGQLNLLPRKGSIGLVAGDVVWAEAPGLIGEAALLELLRLETGMFVFTPHGSPRPRTILRTLMSIVAEALESAGENNEREHSSHPTERLSHLGARSEGGGRPQRQTALWRRRTESEDLEQS